jgi:hypothetical protein
MESIRTFTELKKGFISCLKITLIFTLVFSVFQGEDFSFKNVLFTFLVSAAYTFGIGFGNGIINSLLDKKWDWLEQTNLRVYFGIIAVTIYTVPVVIGINYIVFVWMQKLPVENFLRVI